MSIFLFLNFIFRELEDDTRKYVKKNGIVPTGSAAITSGKFGSLKCKWIIHAVGPMGYGGISKKDKELLASAIQKVLELAQKNDVKTISIPAVSSGIFGFPKDECAKIMIDVAIKNCLKGKSCINEIRFTNIDFMTANIFHEEFEKRIKKGDIAKIVKKFEKFDKKEDKKLIKPDPKDIKK